MSAAYTLTPKDSPHRAYRSMSEIARHADPHIVLRGVWDTRTNQLTVIATLRVEMSMAISGEIMGSYDAYFPVEETLTKHIEYGLKQAARDWADQSDCR